MTIEEIIKLLNNGVNLEYLDEGFWFILSKDSPIRLLFEKRIRIKEVNNNDKTL